MLLNKESIRIFCRKIFMKLFIVEIIQTYHSMSYTHPLDIIYQAKTSSAILQSDGCVRPMHVVFHNIMFCIYFKKDMWVCNYQRFTFIYRYIYMLCMYVRGYVCIYVCMYIYVKVTHTFYLS